MSQDQSPNPSNNGPSTILTLASIVVIIWGLVQAKSFLIPLFAATLLAFLLMPVMRFLARRGTKEWLSLVLSSLLMVLPILLVASLIVNESANLVHNWPTLESSAKVELSRFLASPWAEKFQLQEHLDMHSLFDDVSASASHGFTMAFAGLGAVFAAGSDLVLVLFFAILMLASRKHLRLSFERIFSAYSSPDSAALMDATAEILEKFLSARLLMIVFVAVADFIILRICDVSYSVILSVLLGLTTLIPAVGFILGLVPPFIVAIAQGHGWLSIILMLVALWAVSSVQDHILTPKLIGRRLNLNFFITYLAIFTGERLWGIWGMFLSVPILGVVRILLNSSEQWLPISELIQEHDAELQDSPD